MTDLTIEQVDRLMAAIEKIDRLIAMSNPPPLKPDPKPKIVTRFVERPTHGNPIALLRSIDRRLALLAMTDTVKMTRAIHNTECGYASHYPDECGEDPNPCGEKAERIIAAYVALEQWA